MTRQNHRVRGFIAESFLGLSQDDSDLLAIFHDQVYQIGQIIKQRDESLFEEILRIYTNPTSLEKLKLKVNKSRRNRN